MRVAGSRPQGPVGQVSRGPGAFSTKTTQPLKLRFFANLLVGAWRRRGCRLERLLRRWGPGGERSRDTPPTPPPPRFGAVRGGFLRLRQPSNTPPKVGGVSIKKRESDSNILENTLYNTPIYLIHALYNNSGIPYRIQYLIEYLMEYSVYMIPLGGLVYRSNTEF